jgi:predicted DsbA family dithiol-disulfide isomerase
MPTAQVTVAVDPICPFAFETVLWLREIKTQRDVTLSWQFFSLELINHKPHQRLPYEREWTWGWSMLRIGAYLRRQDPELFERWYVANGTAFFRRGEPVFTPDGAKDVIRSLGMTDDVVALALADDTTHADVLADHEALVAEHGAHGVPTLMIDDGPALFGPVVMPAPTGEDALTLWELVLAWQKVPHLFELRRPKTAAMTAHIDAQMATYLAARPWITVTNPAP